MRKVKYYIGQRRGKHHFGIVLNRVGLWGVPRLLRVAFAKAHYDDLQNRFGSSYAEQIKREASLATTPFIKYSDYDLPRSPETEAVYQATLNKLSPGSSE